jgi:hypothetical protein
VFRGVSADLSKRPSSSGLQVIFGLVQKSLLKWRDTLGDNDSHGKRVIESRNVTEGHDTRKSGISLGLRNIVNSGGGTSRVDDQFSKLGGLLGNLSNASSSILSDLRVHVLEAVENPGEDLRLNDYLSQIDGMLGNLGQTLADVTLELSIRVVN